MTSDGLDGLAAPIIQSPETLLAERAHLLGIASGGLGVLRGEGRVPGDGHPYSIYMFFFWAITYAD